MILLVGATGQLGGVIARRLRGQERHVRALVRERSDHSALVDIGVEPHIGDLKDRASLDRAMRGVDIVITTANSASRGGDDTVDSVEVAGNRSLIDAACEAGVTQFIFTSAMGASVDSPVPFLKGKALTEAHLKRAGTTYTILSPNIFMEVWFGMILGLPLQSGSPITLVGEGHRKHSFVSVDDVAAFAVAGVDNPAARNQQISIGGPEPLSWNDVISRTSGLLGRTLSVNRISPGEALPGLPDVVAGLLAGMDTYDSPVEMSHTCAAFNVTLTPADAVLRRLFTVRPSDA